MQRALAMSMAGHDTSATQFSDPSFVSQLLQESDSDVQVALEQIRQQDEANAEKEKDEKNKKRKNDSM